jgi:hypothetical protein
MWSIRKGDAVACLFGRVCINAKLIVPVSLEGLDFACLDLLEFLVSDVNSAELVANGVAANVLDLLGKEFAGNLAGLAHEVVRGEMDASELEVKGRAYELETRGAWPGDAVDTEKDTARQCCEDNDAFDPRKMQTIDVFAVEEVEKEVLDHFVFALELKELALEEHCRTQTEAERRAADPENGTEAHNLELDHIQDAMIEHAHDAHVMWSLLRIVSHDQKRCIVLARKEGHCLGARVQLKGMQFSTAREEERIRLLQTRQVLHGLVHNLRASVATKEERYFGVFNDLWRALLLQPVPESRFRMQRLQRRKSCAAAAGAVCIFLLLARFLEISVACCSLRKSHREPGQGHSTSPRLWASSDPPSRVLAHFQCLRLLIAALIRFLLDVERQQKKDMRSAARDLEREERSLQLQEKKLVRWE